MSWRDIMRRVLPPIGDLSPEVTNSFGATKGRRPPHSIPHRGVDFNYPIGQTGANLKHPELRSPVAGVVTTNPGEGTYGRIAIRDANGLSHEILHTDAQYVKRGDLVGMGQPIGRMGNTGVDDQHVHYQLKDSAGQVINPTDFWNRLGPAKTDPGQPAYLREYQQYLQGLGATADNGSGQAPGIANTPAPESFDVPSDGSPPLYARQTTRRLGRRIAGKPESFFATGTPAVPFVPPNDMLSPDRQNSLRRRFGSWAPVPAGSSKEAPPANRQDSFSDRFGNWTSSPEESIAPRNPNSPAPPPEPGRPLGIVSGRPMPLWTTPLPLEQLLNKSGASSSGVRFNFLAGLAYRNPTQSAPSATPLAPSDDANFSGGLLGRLTAAARMDPQNPDQPPPDDDEARANIRTLRRLR